MTDIDKFYSDADRLAKHSGYDEVGKNAFAAGLIRKFLSITGAYGTISEELAGYWNNKYATQLDTIESRKEATTWFASVIALLSGAFESDMDFSDNDWEEIQETISAEADTLDINTLTRILSVIVDRGKV